FSQNSDLYQKLVIQEQKVDFLAGELVASPDPYLFSVTARVKRPDDVPYVREQTLAAIENFSAIPTEAVRLETVKQNLRYRFSLSLNNTEAIAGAVARCLGAAQSPDTIDRIY